jgi:hypothetical protein
MQPKGTGNHPAGKQASGKGNPVNGRKASAMSWKPPSYRMPLRPDRTDYAAQAQLAKWNALAQQRGLDAVKAEVVDQLYACTYWLDEVYGPRAAYTLFQNVADQLVDAELAP